jgi:hypothetical protein
MFKHNKVDYKLYYRDIFGGIKMIDKNYMWVFPLYMLFDVPRKFAFVFLYKYLDLLEKKNSLNSNNIDFFFTLIINYIIRYMFVYITTLPFVIVNINNKILLN